MRNECNIVKDLLPLYIDGAVSEDSRKLVEEHTAICESCGRERREMMLALPENAERHVEQDVLAKAARKLRRKHMLRGMLLTIAGLVLGVLLFLGGERLHNELWWTPRVPVSLEDYRISLSLLKDGRLSCRGTASEYEGSFLFWHTSSGPDPSGDGYILNIEVLEPLLVDRSKGQHRDWWERSGLTMKDGKIYDYKGDQVTTITRTGPGGQTEVLYQYGADDSRILPASEEMEEYYRLDDEIELCHELLDVSTSLWREFDETLPILAVLGYDRQAVDDHASELLQQRYKVEATVPEWQ
ncbi:MAG: zf-HC2 domain-containing protein [Christensenellaceae bacterium]|nr:zf-HC2 domain-containing protein [Christensenellaceae bacterium]